MRIGVGAGPVYASTSTAGCGPWVFAFIVLALIAALIFAYPWEAGGVAVLAVGGTVALVRRSRRRAHPFSAQQAQEAFTIMKEASHMHGRGEISWDRNRRIQEESMAIIRRGPRGWEPSDPPPTVES